jgi:hypothetical protein
VVAGGLFTSCEEVKTDDCFEHALIFLYGCAVPAAFLAEHSPGLEVGDGVLDSGPDFAQCGVELGLAGVEVATGRSLERDDLDALDAEVTQVRRGRHKRPEAAKAWASWRAPCTGIGPTAARRPLSVAAIWMFIPAYPALAENRSGMSRQSQVGQIVPSPARFPHQRPRLEGARTPRVPGRSAGAAGPIAGSRWPG